MKKFYMHDGLGIGLRYFYKRWEEMNLKPKPAKVGLRYTEVKKALSFLSTKTSRKLRELFFFLISEPNV